MQPQSTEGGTTPCPESVSVGAIRPHPIPRTVKPATLATINIIHHRSARLREHQRARRTRKQSNPVRPLELRLVLVAYFSCLALLQPSPPDLAAFHCREKKTSTNEESCRQRRRYPPVAWIFISHLFRLSHLHIGMPQEFPAAAATSADSTIIDRGVVVYWTLIQNRESPSAFYLPSFKTILSVGGVTSL